MGRGRAKAKQTKVARDLKYRTFDTDFSSLERELRASSPYDEPDQEPDDPDEYEDPYAEDDDDEDDYPPSGRSAS
ncbi:MAG: DUF3073 domain-containing protein [Actinomycetes bacterium]